MGAGGESTSTGAADVVLFTTSWPVPGRPASGAFVEQLASQVAHDRIVTVITPASTDARAPSSTASLRVRAVRYAPRRWRRLAQGPGGIPAALRAQPWLALLLPSLLGALAWAGWRACSARSVLHANWAITGAVAGLIGRLRRRPVVTTLRGSDVARAANHRPDRWLLALAARLSTCVVAVSPSLAAEARHALGARTTRIEVIPNGVAGALFTIPLARPAPATTLEALTVGSLVASKAVGDVLDALAVAPDMRLTIAGDGPQREELAARAHAAGLATRVQFTGGVEPATIARLLAGAHAFVTASRREGRSNAVLEAMAAGLPVVAADIPSTRELIEHGVSGLLFPAGDSAALAACLARLGDANERARLGAGARARVRALGLTWEAAAQRYAALFDELTGSVDGKPWRAS